MRRRCSDEYYGGYDESGRQQFGTGKKGGKQQKAARKTSKNNAWWNEEAYFDAGKYRFLLPFGLGL